jgi:3-hydroxybutyryl-CoA dehydrogenase
VPEDQPREDQPLTTVSTTTTVIGAGVMGRGIAQVAALAGHATRLVDVSADQLEDALRAIERDLHGGVTRGKLDPEIAAAALARITTTTAVDEGCAGADLVIEAVVERMDVKHQVLAVAERAAAPDAVLATNTSAMSVTEIVGCLDDPSRGVGMHFFNPVPRMRLCELIRGRATTAETLDRAEAAAQAMGKETVRVEDVAGFATSRINALIGAEAMRMLEDGVASAEDIDTAVRLGLNHPMGPLEMGDLVGWDTRLDILEYLAGELGDRFAPTDLHRRLVAEGRLGRKSGRGVHRYDVNGDRIPD